MHFHEFPEDLPKETLDKVTEIAVDHCIKNHCTCDAHVELRGLGLVMTFDSIMEMGAIEIQHTQECYASGRNN